MKAVIVAIAGGSSSGKSWLARCLYRRLTPRAGILALDDFYRDLSHLPAGRRSLANFDHPDALDWPLFETCLKRIRSGASEVMLPRYDFNTHTRLPHWRCWRPRPVVLLEGLWPLWKPKLRRLFALSIYRECPEDLRFRRRLERDQDERGRSRLSVERQFRRQVAPMHEHFVRPQAAVADLVLGVNLSRRELASLANRISCVAKKCRLTT